MKNDSIDKLIQLAWLEGWITTHGAFERSVQVANDEPDTFGATSFIRKLEEAQSQSALTSLTVGELLKNIRAAGKLRAEQLFGRLGLSQNIYKLVEQDAISPLKLPPQAVRRIMKLVGIDVEAMADLLRRTHQFVLYRNSLRGVLARYDSRKQKGMKKTTLEKAHRELYARANLTIPPEDERKLSALMESLKRLN